MKDIRFMYKKELRNYEKELKELNKLSLMGIKRKQTGQGERNRILRMNKDYSYKPYFIEISFS